MLRALLRRRTNTGSATPRRRSRRTVLLVSVGTVMLAVTAGFSLTRYTIVWGATGTAESREALYALLRPVALSNCQLQRFGETHDGGYLMCANLLEGVQSGYSYGISGYDKWGCDISTTHNVPVHQYDCFNTTVPACPTGRTNFHVECVGSTTSVDEGRPFDTIANQFAKNGDASKRIVMKIDVEGAEWDSFLTAPPEILEQIDQLAVEFHGVEDEKSVAVVERLKKYFEVAHVHFNNYSCSEGMAPFPSWAYEVLFVSKRLAVVGGSGQPASPHPLDARNMPLFRDCQAKSH
jgi:hypothetical protein